MQGREQGEISNLPKLKCPSCTYTACSSSCKYTVSVNTQHVVVSVNTVQAVEMQLIMVPLQTQYYVSNSCQLGVIQFPSFQRRNFVINEKQLKT